MRTRSGGDFADGTIAYEGEWLGAEEFISFNAEAVSLLESQGRRARLLSCQPDGDFSPAGHSRPLFLDSSRRSREWAQTWFQSDIQALPW